MHDSEATLGTLQEQVSAHLSELRAAVGDLAALGREMSNVRMLNLLADDDRTLRIELPHLELAADVGLMSAAERKQAATALQQALSQLSQTNAAKRRTPRADRTKGRQKASA